MGRGGSRQLCEMGNAKSRNAPWQSGDAFSHMFTFVMDLVILPPCQGGRRRRKGGCRHGRVCMAEERRRRKGKVDLVFAPLLSRKRRRAGISRPFFSTPAHILFRPCMSMRMHIRYKNEFIFQRYVFSYLHPGNGRCTFQSGIDEP